MKEIFYILFFLFILSACSKNAVDQVAAPFTGEVREIEISAKNWEFIPSEINVKFGEQIRFKVTGLDDGIGSHHSLVIPEFGVNVPVRAGETAFAEFTANKVGSFPFLCSVYCGEGHGTMRGTLVVNE